MDAGSTAPSCAASISPTARRLRRRSGIASWPSAGCRRRGRSRTIITSGGSRSSSPISAVRNGWRRSAFPLPSRRDARGKCSRTSAMRSGVRAGPGCWPRARHAPERGLCAYSTSAPGRRPDANPPADGRDRRRAAPAHRHDHVIHDTLANSAMPTTGHAFRGDHAAASARCDRSSRSPVAAAFSARSAPRLVVIAAADPAILIRRPGSLSRRSATGAAGASSRSTTIRTRCCRLPGRVSRRRSTRPVVRSAGGQGYSRADTA